MASISKIKTSWRALVRRKGFETQCRTFKTEEEAREWAGIIESKIDTITTRKREPKKTTVLKPSQNGMLSLSQIFMASTPAGRICGVYFLILDWRIVYIGTSVDMHRRIAEHRAAGKEFDRTLLLEFADVDTAKKMEKRYIHQFKPDTNQRLIRPSNTWRKKGFIV